MKFTSSTPNIIEPAFLLIRESCPSMEYSSSAYASLLAKVGQNWPHVGRLNSSESEVGGGDNHLGCSSQTEGLLTV